MQDQTFRGLEKKTYIYFWGENKFNETLQFTFHVFP